MTVKLQKPGCETRADDDQRLECEALAFENYIKESHRREQLMGVVHVVLDEATRSILGRPNTEGLDKEVRSLIRSRVHTFEEFVDVPPNERVAQEIEVEMSSQIHGEVHLNVTVPQTMKYLILPVEIGDVVKPW